jgi:hypothetical protein
MIYGYLREQRLEGQVPVPMLYQVTQDGPKKKTSLFVENKGPDCEQFMPLSQQAWNEARDKSIKELEASGLGPRQSHHLKNWSLQRVGAIWKAFLIDLGNCSLRTDTVKRSKERRDNLRLQPCP